MQIFNHGMNIVPGELVFKIKYGLISVYGRDASGLLHTLQNPRGALGHALVLFLWLIVGVEVV
jgi:hypothetical protein